MTAADAAAAGTAAAASARRETSAAPDALHDRDRNSSAGSRGGSGGRSSPLPPPAVTLPDSLIGAVALSSSAASGMSLTDVIDKVALIYEVVVSDVMTW
uniref:Uncharacterized protein n=1 Tax=Oryza meridionalis TaxID=40149 RepID=A0A0E0FDX7_9ORYZ